MADDGAGTSHQEGQRSAAWLSVSCRKPEPPLPWRASSTSGVDLEIAVMARLKHDRVPSEDQAGFSALLRWVTCCSFCHRHP